MPPRTPVLVAVASYTDPVGHAPNAHGDGVVLLDVDVTTGEARTRSSYAGIRNSAFVCAHPTRPILYVVSEIYDGPGTVSSLEFSPDFADVVRRVDLPSGGSVPSYVSLYDDRTLLLTNYADESTTDHGFASLVAFALDDDGHMSAARDVLSLTGSGPNMQRQRIAHGHCLLRRPGTEEVYAADLGADKLFVLDSRLRVLRTVDVPPGSGPRHLAFTPDGAQLLAVHELASQLEVFDINSDGVVSRQRTLLVPDGATSFGADIAVAPDGRRAYVTNREHDSVVAFDNAGGDWRPVAWTRTGAIPRSIALTADGEAAFVTNQEADTITVFATTPGGELVHVSDIPCATPTLVRVVRVVR